MKYSYYDSFINKNTQGRYDITPLFGDPVVFSNLINDLEKPFNMFTIDKIIGIDALGFVLGSVLAFKHNIGFVPIRKGGKLPGINNTVLQESVKDYSNTSKVFEMNKNSLEEGDNVLIVDDWVETGAQIKAAITLIKEQSARVKGITTICAHMNTGTKPLFYKYNLKAINIIQDI